MLLACVMTLLMMVVPAVMATVSAETAGDGVTLYFQNNGGWDNVYCYTWGSSGSVGENWPGAAMTPVAGSDHWYSFTYTSDTPVNAIFTNNSGAQTANHTPADLAVTAKAYWFVPGTETEVTAGGYASGTTVTVYTEAQAGWPGYVAAATAAPTESAQSVTVSSNAANPTTGDRPNGVETGLAGIVALVAVSCVLLRKKSGTVRS